ncbi:MAG: leucyl aminopeptidase family protein [bacterium]
MIIKLAEIQKLKIKKNNSLVIPFFSTGEIEVGNNQIATEIKKFSQYIKSIQEGEFRFFNFEKGEFIFLNLGDKKKWNQRKFFLTIRKIVRYLKENKIEKAVLLLDKIIPQKSDISLISRQVVENSLMADYEFNKYKSTPKNGWPKIKLIEIVWVDKRKYQKEFLKGEMTGRIINFVRDISNIPGGEMTPKKLAEISVSMVRKIKGIKTEVFDENKMKKLKMEGILGISQGSFQKPRLIILKYFGNKNNKKIDLAFIGKGVTFDTGGLNIKPPDALMQEMYLDMSGGAAVLGAIMAIGKLKLPLNIISLIPAVENMPSDRALRPGDIIKSYNGKTIEISHTDAEGRVIMADALAYAEKNFKPKMMVDIATLTGSAMAALGQRAICLVTNSEKMENTFRQIGEESGDYAWPLPCWEEYEEDIKGTVGDISNSSKTKYGGAITAAMFLKNFVDNIPWVHLDIAPTMTSIEGQGLSKGATGTGVRYLIRLAELFRKIK